MIIYCKKCQNSIEKIIKADEDEQICYTCEKCGYKECIVIKYTTQKVMVAKISNMCYNRDK